LDKFQSAFDSNKGLEQVYDEAYDDAIKRIENQHVEERERAIKIISWVTYVQRPLTANELCHAMAVELGDEELDVENFLDIEDIISVCAGLVIVDKRCNVVRFVHYTTQEYFERILRHLNPLAQQQIAQTCLTYLSFNTFLAGTCPSDEDFRSRTERYLFLDYAARHWVYHVKSVQEHLTKLVLVLLQNPNLLSCAVQAMSIPEYQFFGFSQQYPKDVTLLHLTARFGLLHLTRASLTYSRASAAISTNLKDSYGRAPLSWAAGNGHEAVVNLLIERDDIEADSKDAGDRTPLSYAAEGGYEAIVKLLIDRNDVEADSKDNTGRTPLSYAVSSGHESSLKVLLETGRVNPDSKDKNSQTPLAWAAMNGHACVVKLLLATKKVDTDSKTIDRYYDNMSVFGITSFQTPLSLAAENGHEIIVKLLLETHKVNIDSKDEFGRSPLSLAAQNGHAAVVKLLWETGKADPDSKATGRFCAGRTPLSFAAERGYEAIVRQLLGMNQVDPDSKTVGVYLPGRTPLSWAAGNGNEAVVSLLLKTGKVDVNSKSTGKYVPNRAPILWLGNSRERAIELGTTSEIFEGRTPLSWAAESGHTAVIKLLLENGANTSLKDKDGRTPMSWAASNGHEVVTKLLLTTPAVDDASKASL
jgi:ankyrin repeat protein